MPTAFSGERLPSAGFSKPRGAQASPQAEELLFGSGAGGDEASRGGLGRGGEAERKEDDLSLRTCHSGVRTCHSGGPVPCGCGSGRGRGGVEAPAGTLLMGKQAKGAKQGRGGARVAALLGVAASVLVLAAGALLERTMNTVCELLVGLLDRAAGVDLRPPETHLERYLTAYQYEDRREGDGAGPGTSYQHALDEEAMLARSTFPIPPRELVGLTKNLIAADLGVKDPKLLSRDFQFCSPVVGPLKRRSFIAQWEQFRIDKAFKAADNGAFRPSRRLGGWKSGAPRLTEPSDTSVAPRSVGLPRRPEGAQPLLVVHKGRGRPRRAAEHRLGHQPHGQGDLQPPAGQLRALRRGGPLLLLDDGVRHGQVGREHGGPGRPLRVAARPGEGPLLPVSR